VGLSSSYRLYSVSFAAKWPIGPRLRCRRYARRRCLSSQAQSASRPLTRPQQLLDELSSVNRLGRTGGGTASAGADLPLLLPFVTCRCLSFFSGLPTPFLDWAARALSSGDARVLHLHDSRVILVMPVDHATSIMFTQAMKVMVMM
jgi:hypothetical protein